MASKETKTIQPDIDASSLGSKRTKKKKKGKIFFVVLIMLIAIGIAGFLFRKPIGQYVAKNLRNVPVVGNLIKEDNEPYNNITKEQLIKQLEAKKSEQSYLEQTIQDLQQENQELQIKMSSLKEYETKYEDFLSQKEAWDEKIAKTNPNMFLEQFEKTYPETMERIYRDIKIDTQITKSQKQFATTIAQMEPEQAARALEILIPTDPELIKLIFGGMEQERKSLILSNMTSNSAATVIKLLSPDDIRVNE